MNDHLHLPEEADPWAGHRLDSPDLFGEALAYGLNRIDQLTDAEIQAAEEAADDAVAPWHVLALEQVSGGTVCVFRCEDPTGAQHLVGVDHRLARDIVDGLNAPTGEDGVYIERPEAWQIIGHVLRERRYKVSGLPAGVLDAVCVYALDAVRVYTQYSGSTVIEPALVAASEVGDRWEANGVVLEVVLV